MSKITLNIITSNLINRLQNRGWAFRWADSFVQNTDSQILIKELLSALSNDFKLAEVVKLLKEFENDK